MRRRTKGTGYPSLQQPTRPTRLIDAGQGKNSPASSPPASSPPPVGSPGFDPNTDPIYGAALQSAASQRDVTQSGLQQEARDAIRGAGYQQDPNNPFGFGGFDPSNPFSRASLLQRAYDQNTRGNTNNYAARGQLYSGALQNQQNETLFGYQRDENSLQTQLGSILGGLAGQSAQAGTDYLSAGAGALSDAGQRYTDNPPPPSAPTPPAAAAQPARSGLTSGDPKFPFVQASGTRKGMKFTLDVRGNDVYRRYENGDVVKVP